MKELLIYISIICIFLIGLSLYVFIQSKNKWRKWHSGTYNKIKKSSFVSQEAMMKKMEEIPIYTKKKPRNRENDWHYWKWIYIGFHL